MASRRKRSHSKAGKSDSQLQTPTETKRLKTDDVLPVPMLTEESATEDVNRSLVSTFTSTCSRIAELFGRVKGSGEHNINSELELAEWKGEVSLLMIKLKQLNRDAQIRCKEARDKTSEARQRIDDQHLQLQNLLYQVMHLQKEIHECLEFKSRDEDIELVSEGEFYQDAPKTISKPNETQTDSHKRMLARLDWELEQRKQLTQQLELATFEKQKLLEDIESKRKFLSSLQPQLDVILKATIPVQAQMGMQFEKIRTQHALAMHLPSTLYVLFVQASAYQEALDPNLTVSIEGDVDAAKLFVVRTDPVADEGRESDSDREESQSQKRKKRRRSVNQALLEKQANLMKTHPLSIRFTVKCNDQTDVVVDFHSIVALGIVTVKVFTEGQEFSDLLDPSSLLIELFSGDTGLRSPNPTNSFQMKKLGLHADSFDMFAEEVGLPYKWAQWIAGLDFLPDSHAELSPAFAASKMEFVVGALKQRLETRVSLRAQITQLGHLSVSDLTKSETLFPRKVKSKLISWKQYSKDEVETYLDGRSEMTIAMVTPTANYCYRADIQHGSAKLTTLIAINICYPRVPPLFIISVNNGASGAFTSDNDLNIKMLEAEVNVYWKELICSQSADLLLSLQIRRLQMCFDVYLECKQTVSGHSRKDRLWNRLACGKHRCLPVVYQSDQGFFRPR